MLMTLKSKILNKLLFSVPIFEIHVESEKQFSLLDLLLLGLWIMNQIGISNIQW
jgi:hypothetical protein